MSAMPLVTVIIPAYNAERFLAMTLTSLRNQTYPNLEILVVDDGSTDSTSMVISKFARLDSGITGLSKTNGGVASARNFGLERAQGEYVAFLDADDIWHPAKIERQMNALLGSTNGTGEGAIYALYRFIDNQNNILASGTFRTLPGAIASHIITLPVENCSSILTRRDLALAVGGFDPSYRELNAGGAEDFDFELKLASRVPISVLPEYLVGYRKYPGNMSSDVLLMARAIDAVVEKNISANPGLSRHCVRWARAKVLADRFVRLIHMRRLGDALLMMPSLISSDPVAALHLLSLRIPEMCLSWVASRFIPRNADSIRQFYEADPRELGRRPAAYQTRRLIKYCKREDAALLSSSNRSSAPVNHHQSLQPDASGAY
jgi:glycosyltransferase involved in cell wall biosynthesis